jgi:hypothetical protein
MVAPKIAICSIDARTRNGRKNRLPRREVIAEFQRRMLRAAPKHTVLYWTEKAPEFGVRVAPFDMEVEIPFYTTQGSFFIFSGEKFEGIHVQYDPVEGDETAATAMFNLADDEGVHAIALDQLCWV